MTKLLEQSQEQSQEQTDSDDFNNEQLRTELIYLLIKELNDEVVLDTAEIIKYADDLYNYIKNGKLEIATKKVGESNSDALFEEWGTALRGTDPDDVQSHNESGYRVFITKL